MKQPLHRPRSTPLPVLAALLLAAGLGVVHAGTSAIVQFCPSPGSFPLVRDGVAATLYVDASDDAGVARAAAAFRSDVRRVTGVSPAVTHREPEAATSLILAGTLDRSAGIQRLIRDGKLDVSAIRGKWESYIIQVVPEPFPGVAAGLVIAGSDKRGAIFGLYELSAQMGVSPWYWWADVPVPRHDGVFVKPGRHLDGPPAVRYRGIFLNDEAPSLTGWVREKFGNYNHRFYTNVFELLLRLKGNFLWPAMWDNSFATDDPLNPKLADEYGIVMSTSHHEPMMRAWKEWERAGHGKGTWDYSKNGELLRAFWEQGLRRTRDFEKVITLGMRGDGDEPMSERESIALLERIVADQRKLISEIIDPNLLAVPQVWTLYKEVLGYYDKGMRVPDDVTLLWCDDNWGNLRRLPTASERRRPGGAGIYYHFDYVGGPRNYKWVNTIPLPRVWEQMNLAWNYGADRIWVVNVGDLKPLELPIDFFLNLAWDPARLPVGKLRAFTEAWAARQFGPAHAAEIAGILDDYARFNGWRKPELLEPDSFSLLHYREAERVIEGWKSTAARAEKIYRELPDETRDAFYQLALYPVKACCVVNELYFAVGMNRLAARQGRASAHRFADRARALFREDAALADYYNHKLAGGKWNHMMDQTHIGYTSWQQPPSNTLPALAEIDLPAAPALGVALEGSASGWPGDTNEPALPLFDSFNQPRRYIDVFNRGRESFAFSASATEPWITVEPARGTVADEQRVWVAVNWQKAPKGTTVGAVKISRPRGEVVAVKVKAFNPSEISRERLTGFVETDGCVSIDAPHYTRKVDGAAVRWEMIPGLGRTGSAMTITPGTAPSVTPPEGAPCLEYRMYLFDQGVAQVELQIAPTLNFVPGRGLRLAVSFDDQPSQVLTAVPPGYVAGDGVRDWEESVRNNIRRVKSAHTIGAAGYHTLKVWMVDPGVVLEKLVVDFGGARPCYFGPPESFHRQAP